MSLDTDDLLAAGRDHAAAGRYEAALEAFERAAAAGSVEGAYGAGAVLLGLGRLDAAEAYLNEVVDRDPEHANAIFQLGAIAERRGDHAGAHRLFERTLQAQRDHVSARQRLQAAAQARAHAQQAQHAWQAQHAQHAQHAQFQPQAWAQHQGQTHGRPYRHVSDGSGGGGLAVLLVPLIGLAVIATVFFALILPSIREHNARSDAIGKQGYEACMRNFSPERCEVFKP